MMRLILRVILVSLFLGSIALPANAALSSASIPAVFDELLKNQRLANPAMVVIDGSTGQLVYEKNGFSQRKPASVMKLLTAAATIQHLDVQSTFNTTININPEIKTVIIRGSFDPWISLDHKTARKMSRASLPFMGFETLKGVKALNDGSLKNYDVIYSNLYSQDVANLKSFWSKRGFKPTFKSV
jgi:D-alanyl-D-alanine carboxypeptidase